jgi:hypothetical protein
MKIDGLFLDVDLDGNEVFIDESGDLRIGVDFGIQPSAGPSGGSGAEVQQQRFLLFLRQSEGGIDILGEIDGHSLRLPPVELDDAGGKLAAIAKAGNFPGLCRMAQRPFPGR